MSQEIENVNISQNLSAIRQSRKLHFLRAALVGICAACLAIAFQWGISRVGASVHFFVTLVNSPTISSLLVIAICTSCGLVAGFLTQAYCPEAGGSGIPHVKAVLLHLRTLHVARLLPIKFIGGMLTVGAGFSLGREGPTVHLGAAVADGIGKLLKVPIRSKNHLVACGAGAGLAAAFNAPLAGFIFVIEELRREFSPITYGAAFIAAVIADGVTRLIMGIAPSLKLSVFHTPPLATVPSIVIIGLVVGACGILFNRSILYGLRSTSKKLSLWQKGAIAGFCVGITTLIVPNATLDLQGTIDHFLHSQDSTTIAMWVFAGYFSLKYALTIICYISGVPGGIFAPMLVQGVLLGIFVGRVCGYFFPAGGLQDGVCAIIGMCAFFASSVRAPLTGVVLIAEMTNSFNLLFLLLATSLISYLLAEVVGGKPIYEGLMELELRKENPKRKAPGEAVIIDVVVEPHSLMDGLKVCDLRLPRGCLMITVKQHGKEIVPHGETIITEGDEVAFLVDDSATDQIIALRKDAATRSP